MELSLYIALEFMRQTKQSRNEGTDCLHLKVGHWKRPPSCLKHPCINICTILSHFIKL